MVDTLLWYSIAGSVWAFCHDICRTKGKMMQTGFVVFFPFVACTLFLEVLRGK